MPIDTTPIKPMTPLKPSDVISILSPGTTITLPSVTGIAGTTIPIGTTTKTTNPILDFLSKPLFGVNPIGSSVNNSLSGSANEWTARIQSVIDNTLAWLAKFAEILLVNTGFLVAILLLAYIVFTKTQ